VLSTFDSSDTESVKGGAIVTGHDITHVLSTLEIPVADMPIRGPTGGNVVGKYEASYWVGLGAANKPTSDACSSSLRVGIDTFWDQNLTTYVAWYEWYPAPSKDFINCTVAPGDTVRLMASANADGAAGTVTLHKLDDKGEFQLCGQESLAAADSTRTKNLCLSEAAWIVEDFPLVDLPDIPMALANFTSVTFDYLAAGLPDGKQIDLSGATVMDINQQQQGGQLTACTLDKMDESLTCKRVVGGV
jgi:hypothetical protein